jgi:hypothetical protein
MELKSRPRELESHPFWVYKALFWDQKGVILMEKISIFGLIALLKSHYFIEKYIHNPKL